MTDQHSLNTGFTAQTTPAEVMSSVDLRGQVAVVTGGYSGIGLAVVEHLVRARAFVIVPARREQVAKDALRHTPAVVVPCDLAEPLSVREAGREISGLVGNIDLLVNNAGVMAPGEQRNSLGWELQLAVNHLGHVVLTDQLWPLLAAPHEDRQGPSRVVAVSSAGHHRGGIHWEDPHWTENYDKWGAYGQAKTAVILFAKYLGQLLGPAGKVLPLSVHPGNVFTPLQRHLVRAEIVERGWISEDGSPSERFRGLEEGAATPLWAATSPVLLGRPGVYCEDCDVAPVATADTPFRGIKAYADDADQARRLWDLTLSMVEVPSLSALAGDA